jgi:hypothetical protein
MGPLVHMYQSQKTRIRLHIKKKVFLFSFLFFAKYFRQIYKMQSVCDDVQSIIWGHCSLSGYDVCRTAHDLCIEDFRLAMQSFMTWRMLSHINKPIVRRIAHEQMDRFEHKFKLLVLPQRRKYGALYRVALETTRVPCLLFHSAWGLAVRLRRHQI